jgi:TetR/AcrR family transcriptional regulator
MAPRKAAAKVVKAPAPPAQEMEVAPVTPALGGPTGRRNRRSPAPEDRLIDADRTRAALLEAALEEFSAKGYAGARVREIAARADVSKDLIAYHFGGKEGLYLAVQEARLSAQTAAASVGGTLADRVVEALGDALIDRRPMRLMAWHGLTGAVDPDGGVAGMGESPAVEPTEDLRRRQEAGEVSGDLDPATLELVLLGAVAAPVIFPDMARQLFGVDPDRREFEVRYREGLVRLVEYLAPRSNR